MRNNKIFKKLTADNVSYNKTSCKYLRSKRTFAKTKVDGKKVIAECRTKDTCFICRKAGHHAKDCPNKIKRRQLATQHAKYDTNLCKSELTKLQNQIAYLTKLVRSMIAPKALEITQQQFAIIPVKTTQPQVQKMKVKANPGPHVVCLNVEQPLNKPPMLQYVRSKPFPTFMTKHQHITQFKTRQIEKNGQPATVELRFNQNQYIYEKGLAYIPRHLGLDYMLDEFFISNAIEYGDVLRYLYTNPNNRLATYVKTKLGLDLSLILSGRKHNLNESNTRIFNTILYRIRHQYFTDIKPTYHLSGIPENMTPESYAYKLSLEHDVPFLYNNTSVAWGYCVQDSKYYTDSGIFTQSHLLSITGDGYWHVYKAGAKFLICGGRIVSKLERYREIFKDDDCDYSDDIDEVLRTGTKPRNNMEEHI